MFLRDLGWTCKLLSYLNIADRLFSSSVPVLVHFCVVLLFLSAGVQMVDVNRG